VPTTFQFASNARINQAESLEREYFLFPDGEFRTPTAHTYLEALTVSLRTLEDWCFTDN